MRPVFLAWHGKPAKVQFQGLVYKQTQIHPQILQVDGIDFVTTMVKGNTMGEKIVNTAGCEYHYIAFNFDVYEKSSDEDEDEATDPELLKVVAISRHGNYGAANRKPWRTSYVVHEATPPSPESAALEGDIAKGAIHWFQTQPDVTA